MHHNYKRQVLKTFTNNETSDSIKY